MACSLDCRSATFLQKNEKCALRKNNFSKRLHRPFLAQATPHGEKSHSSTEDASGSHTQRFLKRRELAFLGVLGYQSIQSLVIEKNSAEAFIIAPPGFRAYVDKINGFYFFYPETWVQVKGAGDDAFFRGTFRLDENLSVNVSSPTSSRYKDIHDLGTPEEAGKRIIRQYLTEFMSTRLGVQRIPSLISFDSVTSSDGKEYYYVEANVKSYANNNELAIMPDERIPQLEWDRRYLLVLGVENSRLYQLRLQLPERFVAEDLEIFRKIMESFRTVDVASS